MATRQKSDLAELKASPAAARRIAEPVRRAEPGTGRDEEFLRAALDLFAERNFAAVTIKDIAQALGVNTALIYYYFENKMDLFRATIEFAVENAFENMRALEDAGDNPVELFSMWLQNHVDRHAEIHRFVKIALDYRGSHEGDPAIEASIAGFYAKERELLSRFITMGIEKGLFDPVDPGRTANFISTYLDGCMVRLVILPEFNLKQTVADLHAVVLEHLGYRKRKPARRRR